MTGTLPQQALTLSPRWPIRVYTASKLRHAAMLAKQVGQDGIYLTARWLATAGHPGQDMRPASHWLQDNFDDIERSEFVLVYVEQGEHLKGGLVEAGLAIHAGKTLVLVSPAAGHPDSPMFLPGGNHPDFSKWKFHPLCHRAASIEAALLTIKLMARQRRGGQGDAA